MPPRLLRLPSLLRLVLLAVFFNAAIGVPLHEAGHWRQAVQSLAQEAASEDLADLADVADAGHPEEAHGVCAWCLAHAHQGTPPARSPAALEVARTMALPRAPPGERFVPDPGRWPFASRDPPHAPT